MCIDEVIGEIDSPKDEVEFLHPLEMKLQQVFLDCSIQNINMIVYIAINKKPKEIKQSHDVYFNNDPECEFKFSHSLEENLNDDLNVQWWS